MSISYYCTLCNEYVLKQMFEQHRAMHLENPFITYPESVEAYLKISEEYREKQTEIDYK